MLASSHPASSCPGPGCLPSPSPLLAACAHLPPLAPVAAPAAAAATPRCLAAFPPPPWRATHAIFATLPFGYHGALLGVTAVESGALHAMLLAPEGITLFDGRSKGPWEGPLEPARVGQSPPVPARVGTSYLEIAHAVPPFDRPAFASSLMADVSSGFLAPAGAPPVIGLATNGATVCRWSRPGGETTDIELAAQGPRAIRTFHGPHLSREIFLSGTPEQGFYPLVVLQVPGRGGYHKRTKKQIRQLRGTRVLLRQN